jgi:uncharacterized protein GlcG (DUF336 family)
MARSASTCPEPRLVDDGRVVGAVGVSGAVPADNDHLIAEAALGGPSTTPPH